MIVRKIKKAETFQGVSLYTLLGQMAAKKQFIEQSHPHFEEFWNCHRELAELERAFDQANKLWMSHQHEARRTNQTRSGWRVVIAGNHGKQKWGEVVSTVRNIKQVGRSHGNQHSRNE
jgi:hypothetical protein